MVHLLSETFIINQLINFKERVTGFLLHWKRHFISLAILTPEPENIYFSIFTSLENTFKHKHLTGCPDYYQNLSGSTLGRGEGMDHIIP